MERPRFSGKELMKHAKTEVVISEVISEDYSQLHNAEIVRETEKAYLINFTINSETKEIWFPKQYVIKKDLKYYASDWIINKNFNSLNIRY